MPCPIVAPFTKSKRSIASCCKHILAPGNAGFVNNLDVCEEGKQGFRDRWRTYADLDSDWYRRALYYSSHQPG